MIIPATLEIQNNPATPDENLKRGLPIRSLSGVLATFTIPVTNLRDERETEGGLPFLVANFRCDYY